MSNQYFTVDVGVNVGGVSINGTTSNVATTGNLVVTGAAGNVYLTSNPSNWTTATTGANLVMTGGNITMTTGNITLGGNIVTSGNIILNTSQISYNANSVTPKSYVDNMAVVFGV